MKTNTRQLTTSSPPTSSPPSSRQETSRPTRSGPSAIALRDLGNSAELLRISLATICSAILHWRSLPRSFENMPKSPQAALEQSNASEPAKQNRTEVEQ